MKEIIEETLLCLQQQNVKRGLEMSEKEYVEITAQWIDYNKKLANVLNEMVDFIAQNQPHSAQLGLGIICATTLVNLNKSVEQQALEVECALTTDCTTPYLKSVMTDALNTLSA